ncbi:MAG: putative sugar nucleotidyl transferase [Brevinematia bacterium]
MVVLFEEKESVFSLGPFTLTRPVQDLKSGFLTMYERLSYLLGSEVKVITRKEMMFYFPETKLLSYQDISKKNEMIFINSSYLWPDEDFKHTLNSCFLFDGRVIFLHVNSSDISMPDVLFEGLYESDLQKIQDSLKVKISQVTLTSLNNFAFYPWDLVYLNTYLMKKDFDLIIENTPRDIIDFGNSNVELEGSRDLLVVFKRAQISKGTFVDTNDGPVVIDSESRVLPMTVITGPSYIGKKTIVSQARIREGTNIRNVCKVSGEIEESIIDSFSNKNHEGFLGHSYVGQWVNIGAMATNSDLKNTYDEVKVFVRQNRVVNTGLIKVGCFIGDFSKIGIGVLINTGTVIGVGANVFFEGELIRKYVPNFAWGGKEPYKKFPLSRFIDMVKTMFSRRGKEFDKSVEDLITNLYNQSS